MQKLVINWDDTYTRTVGFVEADRQVRSVAPDIALNHEDQRDLLAAVELIRAHRAGQIDFADPNFAMTEALVLANLSDLEDRLDVTLVTT